MRNAKALTACALAASLIAFAAGCSSTGSAGGTSAQSQPAPGTSAASGTGAAPGTGAASGAGTSAAPVAVQGVSADKVITIGGFIAQSGPLAVVKNIKDAADLRFKMVNDAGGVNGYTFKYIAVDDQADPSKTVGAVKELWENDKVFALFLPYGSGANNAAKSYVLSNDIPTLFPFADARIYFTVGQKPPANVFGFIPPYSEMISQLVTNVSKSKAVKKIAVVHTNDDTGQSGPDALKALAPQLGFEIVADIGYDGTETNFAPIGRRVAESGAEATLLWAIAGSTQILAAAQESGYQGAWMAQDAFRGGVYLDALKKLPALKDRFFINVYQTSQNVGDPKVQEFLDAFTKAYPKDDKNIANAGWVASSILIEAVRKATAGGAALTWPLLRSTLESFHDENINGAVGITYTADNHFGATKAAVRVFDGSDFTTVADFETLPGFK